jgi:hypothetical protein
MSCKGCFSEKQKYKKVLAAVVSAALLLLIISNVIWGVKYFELKKEIEKEYRI